MGRLTGKVAFITGIGGGMGRSAARLFAAEGAVVVGCDINPTWAERTTSEVLAAGGRIITSTVDLSVSDQAEAWIASGVAQAGDIDILYNNAAAGVTFSRFDEFTFENWSQTLRNELDLMFNAARAAWPRLVARGGGAILNTSSAATMRGHPNLGIAAHATAKAGVVAFTQQLAAEGAPHRIRVNAISPGPINTPATAELPSDLKEKIATTIPLGRWGECEDVANGALYLVSDEARWVTAANLVIDGGSFGIF